MLLFTDINECLDNNVTCSHDCVNTEGSYHCECFTGYILQLNKYDCEGKTSLCKYLTPIKACMINDTYVAIYCLLVCIKNKTKETLLADITRSLQYVEYCMKT